MLRSWATLASNKLPPVQALPRKPVILATTVVVLVLMLFRLYGTWPVDSYGSYAPGEAMTAAVSAYNDGPQPGYFKTQPEWDWEVPDYASGWKGYARTPRNRDVVVLTASDGGGHNSVIPNVLERVLDDRTKYCQKHGYTPLWLNTSRYDIGDAHRTWSKIPAVAEAFYLHPSAEWVWLVDTDIIIMTPAYDLVSQILSPDAITRSLLRNAPILDGQFKKNRTNVSTPADFRVQDIDILLTQDHQSLNTGSIFFRRSAFTRWFLEMMTDYTMLMGSDHPSAEQDAVKHMMLEHQLVRNHIGIYPQRKFNAYVRGGDNMGYRDGDLLIHFAGCWTGNKCQGWFEEFWSKKGVQEAWRPEGQ